MDYFCISEEVTFYWSMKNKNFDKGQPISWWYWYLWVNEKKKIKVPGQSHLNSGLFQLSKAKLRVLQFQENMGKNEKHKNVELQACLTQKSRLHKSFMSSFFSYGQTERFGPEEQQFTLKDSGS